MGASPASSFTPVQFLEQLSVPAFIVAESAMVEYANPAVVALLQTRKDVLEGNSWAGIDAQLTLIHWKGRWRKLAQQQQLSYKTDVSIDGERLVPVAVELVSIAEDKAIIFLTEQSEPLRTALERQLIQEHSELGLWSYRADEEQWTLDDKTRQLLNIGNQTTATFSTPELRELLGSAAWQMDSWQLLLTNIQAALDQQTHFEQEVLFTAGPYQRLNVAAVVQSNAIHTVQIVGIMRPTLHQRTDDQFASMAAFSIEHARDMVFWLRKNGTLAYANRALCKELGYERSEMERTVVDEFVTNNTPAIREQLWEDIRQQLQTEGEVALKRKNGSIFTAQFHSNFISFEKEDLVCVALRNISPEQERSKLLEITQSAIDNALDLVFWTRPDGSFMYCNQQVCKTLKYSKADFEQMEVRQIAPYFDEEVLAAFWKELREKRFIAEEYKIYTSDNEEVTINGYINYVEFNGQELACSFCRNITAEKAKMVRRELSEFTLDSARDAILWVAPDGSISYVNDKFLQLAGRTEAEVLGQLTRSFFPEATPKRRKFYWDTIRQEGHAMMETILIQKDGTHLPVRADFNYLFYDGIEYNCIYIRDWREKKVRDLSLKLSQATIDSANEAIVWIDQDGHVKYLNQSMLAYLGGNKQEWEGKKWQKVFPQLTAKQLQAGQELEYSLLDAEGGRVYLELSFREVLQDGEQYMTIVGRNFTERYLRRLEMAKYQRQIEELSARLQEENIALREDVSKEYSINNIVTVSPSYQNVLQKIGQVADTDTTVLILGETGTGKELLARAVHQLSERSDEPLIKVNCAALPENLIESELFGHEKGAFTGAQDRKKGRFELAHKGTIFLDEVGEMPLSLQPKLLRVLQEGEFERVGGTKTIKVDVRLVAATNRSLEKMVKKGKFRADLYYRLNVFPIENLALRERPDDITVLAEFFTRRFAKRQGKTIDKINAADLKRLKKYRFPGNVRELENIIERAVVLCNGNILRISLDRQEDETLWGDNTFPSFTEMQRRHIIKALKRTKGRITGPEGAGRLLGINDRTLMSKIKKLEIEKREYLI